MAELRTRIPRKRPRGRATSVAKPWHRTALLLLLALAVAAEGCGGGSDPTESARELYRSYRTAEDERTNAEERLRQAFADIAVAAEAHDRDASLAAVDRGHDAVRDIERLLEREHEAAGGLAGFVDVQDEAVRLRDGLETTRASLRLFAQQLEIAGRDPFLTVEANVDAIRTLARRAAKLAVDGELEIRRADRAIALALGLEPRVDRVVETETATTQ